MITSTARPKHLNLFKIRFPGTAIVSIAHRISGFLLFLFTPFLIYLLAMSLRSKGDYLVALSWLDNWAIQVGLLALIWALAHHLLAGIRHLLLDIDIGVDLRSAQISAWFVSLASIGISVGISVGIFLWK